MVQLQAKMMDLANLGDIRLFHFFIYFSEILFYMAVNIPVTNKTENIFYSAVNKLIMNTN